MAFHFIILTMKRILTLASLCTTLFLFHSFVYAESVPPQDASAAPTTAVSSQKTVKSIEIKGNKTIGIPLILSKIKTRVGDAYLENVISDDLKRLYNTGYFSDVSVDRQDYEGGFKVVILLVEKPIVEKITFSKTKFFNPRTFQIKIQTKEGKFLDNKTLKDDVDTIRDLYVKKGLTYASIEDEVKIDQTTNKARVDFKIQEGKGIKIQKIKVEGNLTFSEKRVVHLMKTRSAWLFNPGRLQEDTLKEDMDRIKDFYEQEGFPEASADYSLLDDQKGHVTVSVHVQEGKRFYVGEIKIVNNKVVSADDIRKTMKDVKEGKVFSRNKLDSDLSAIHTLYFDKGYIFAEVKQSSSLNPQTGKVDLVLAVNEGDVAYVNKIKIEGNARTRDTVIRRELRIAPGDKFDGAKLRRSKERLKDLQYFEDINYDIEDTAITNKKDLVVQVKETKTGTLSFGGGYSTVDQVVGFVEIEQKNFDFTNWPTFTGGGQNLSVHAEAGSIRNNQRLSFTEPYIFDYPVSGGFDLYRTQHSQSESVGYAYDESRIGGDIRFGKQLSEYLSAGTTYRLENIEISNLVSNASADLQAEVGKNTVSTVGLSVTNDNRDSRISPTKGLMLNGSIDIAGGPLGGDKDFYRLFSHGSYDIPMPKNSVLEFRLQSGIIKSYGNAENVPIFERFFAGGAYTIRGYNERKVGPIDTVTEDPLGGESTLVGNIEYIIPLIDFVKVATFYDVGNVWADMKDFGSGGFKSGAGFGLRVKTPIGPINLDYGFPLNSEPGEDSRSGKFYFSVSRGF